MNKQKLEILTAFTIMARRAVDRLREEYFGAATYGTSPEQLRASLDKIRTEHLPESLKDNDAEFFSIATRLSEALFEQLMISQQLLKAMYNGQSSSFLHCHLLDEAVERSEAILRIILDLAMEGALGRKASDLRK